MLIFRKNLDNKDRNKDLVEAKIMLATFKNNKIELGFYTSEHKIYSFVYDPKDSDDFAKAIQDLKDISEDYLTGLIGNNVRLKVENCNVTQIWNITEDFYFTQ